jgi:hypothetical protein
VNNDFEDGFLRRKVPGESYGLAQGETFDMRFRMVRMRLPDGSFETLFTNLPKARFPKRILYELYHSRWIIEGGILEAKYYDGLLYNVSESPEYCIMESFVALLRHNITVFIASLSKKAKERMSKLAKRFRDKLPKRYIHINYPKALHSIMEFLLGHERCGPGETEDALNKAVVASEVIPSRMNPRTPRPRRQQSHNYR